MGQPLRRAIRVRVLLGNETKLVRGFSFFSSSLRRAGMPANAQKELLDFTQAAFIEDPKTRRNPIRFQLPGSHKCDQGAVWLIYGTSEFIECVGALHWLPLVAC